MRAKPVTFERARTLRRTLTLPEVILWSHIRPGRFGGLRFRRQHPIGPYILDFFCPSARVAVEVDGQGHAHPDQEAHDRTRDDWLAKRGVAVVRIAAAEVLDDLALEIVLKKIEAVCRGRSGLGPPPPLRGPPPPFTGEDLP